MIDATESSPMLAEMRKQTAILERMADQQALLLQALAEDGDEPEEAPQFDLAGRRV